MHEVDIPLGACGRVYNGAVEEEVTVLVGDQLDARHALHASRKDLGGEGGGHPRRHICDT